MTPKRENTHLGAQANKRKQKRSTRLNRKKPEESSETEMGSSPFYPSKEIRSEISEENVIWIPSESDGDIAVAAVSDEDDSTRVIDNTEAGVIQISQPEGDNVDAGVTGSSEEAGNSEAGNTEVGLTSSSGPESSNAEARATNDSVIVDFDLHDTGSGSNVMPRSRSTNADVRATDDSVTVGFDLHDTDSASIDMPKGPGVDIESICNDSAVVKVRFLDLTRVKVVFPWKGNDHGLFISHAVKPSKKSH